MGIRIIDFLKTIDNKEKLLGGLIGLLISVMVLVIGFFKTLFICICTGIGYSLGGKPYDRAKIKDWLERVLPPGGIG